MGFSNICFLSGCVALLFSDAYSPELAKKSHKFNPESTEELLNYWKNNYSNTQLKEFTFTQETVRYRDNGDRDSSTWYEAMQFPCNFRIDFGEKSQNTNLYRNDSLYVFRKGKQVHKEYYLQDFMIMSGRFYTQPIDSTLKQLRAIGVNPNLFYTTIFKGEEVYVIGSEKGEDRPQIWLSAIKRVVLKHYLKAKETDDITIVVFDQYVKIKGHWIETWLEFYHGETLIQTERYYDIDVKPNLPPETFNPNKALNYYWY